MVRGAKKFMSCRSSQLLCLKTFHWWILKWSPLLGRYFGSLSSIDPLKTKENVLISMLRVFFLGKVGSLMLPNFSLQLQSPPRKTEVWIIKETEFSSHEAEFPIFCKFYNTLFENKHFPVMFRDRMKDNSLEWEKLAMMLKFSWIY